MNKRLLSLLILVLAVMMPMKLWAEDTCPFVVVEKIDVPKDITGTWSFADKGIMEATMAFNGSSEAGEVEAMEKNGLKMTIETNGASFRNNGDNIQVRTGAVFKIPVKNAGDLITVVGYPGYSYYTIAGGAELNNENTYKAKISDAEAGYVAVKSTNDNNYFKSLSVVQYAPKEKITLDNEPATATFPFGEGTEGQKATFSNADYFLSSKVTVGGNWTIQDSNTYVDAKETRLTPTDQHNDNLTDDDAVSFLINPKPGFTFTPTKVGFKANRFGTDNGLIDVYWLNPDGTTVELDKAISPERNNSGKNTVKNYDITGATAGEGICGLKFYLYKLQSDKQIGLADIVLEGFLSGTETTVPVLAEPYAVLSEDNVGSMALTFYYDGKKEERGGLSFQSGTDVNWPSSITSVTQATFDESFVGFMPTSTSYWFAGFSSLTSIMGMEYLNTSNVTDMSSMFYGCSSLTTLDLSNFNTSLVANMNDMFANSTSLTTIYVTYLWTTEAAESNFAQTGEGTHRTFQNCTQLVGGAGTKYDENDHSAFKAHIDGGPDNPGYLTDKNASMIDDNIIQFADVNVKAICVKNWDTDGDGELSKAEAANVISLDNAFTGNKDITSFDEFQYFVGVIALGSREFGGCYNLSSIILPPNLKSLEAESLNGNKIDELTIPASVTSIEPSALYATYKNIFVEEGNAYFSSIDGVLFNKDITKIVTYPERKEAESYEIPNTVVTIGRCAFYSSELKSVTIPYGVNTIEGSAFRYCGNLESIDIPGSVETIGYDNFEFANSLTTATIPSSVKSIDTGVFASCQNLQEIIVDTNNQYYTSVDGVLYTKDKTHLVTYPAGKPDENVVIPNYVTSIGQCGVYGCNNIKSVVIPKRVESIGWFAFVNCANLNSVTTHRKKPLELTKTFDDRAQQNGTLYVPYGTKELYQAADEWNGFQNIVELDPSAIISLVNNGDMEGEDNGNFFVRTNYSSGNEEPVQAAISNGVGVNGSRGIKVEATSKLAVSWDNQFWVRLNQPISEGTLYRVSFDYRAEKEAMIGAEAHEEPSAYINWGFFGNDIGFTDSWSHFEYEGTMSSLNSKDELPFQSLTFSFNNNFEAANNYYFDNFKFEVVMEDQCPKPTFKQKGNEISILSPFNAKIYYTLDGSTPTTSSQVYAGSLKLTENAEINAIAVVEGYEASPVATCKFVHPQFDSNGVLAVTGRTRLSDALEAVGGREEVAKTITAILWEGNYAVYNTDLQGLDNPNMLIYVNDESLAPQNRDNVIIGDFAKNIVLTDVSEGNGNFYCPRTFKAEMISYTHEYRQQTEIGVSRGWETIALPFTVQTIMHEKNGLIAPFGNDASGKHFWLRQLTQEGLARATTIEANTPYIISMPNNSEYPAEFNQAGRVTFSSQNAIVPVTEIRPFETHQTDGSMLIFVPCFQRQSANDMIYALNVGEQRGGYPEGSVFEANYREARPFEAFTVHEGGQRPAPQYISIDEMNGGATGIEDVRGQMSDGRSDSWYDLSGRKLQKKPNQNGVYIQNGRRVVIK